MQGRRLRKKCAAVSTVRCECSLSPEKKRGKCGVCAESLVGAPVLPVSSCQRFGGACNWGPPLVCCDGLSCTHHGPNGDSFCDTTCQGRGKPCSWGPPKVCCNGLSCVGVRRVCLTARAYLLTVHGTWPWGMRVELRCPLRLNAATCSKCGHALVAAPNDRDERAALRRTLPPSAMDSLTSLTFVQSSCYDRLCSAAYPSRPDRRGLRSKGCSRGHATRARRWGMLSEGHDVPVTAGHARTLGVRGPGPRLGPGLLLQR